MQSARIIELYKAGYGGHYIAKELRISPYFVYKALKANNIPRRSDREKSLKYSVNEEFFNDIDTERKAYWLGFLAADGTQNGQVVACAHAMKDKEHLEALRIDLSAQHPVIFYTNKTGMMAGYQYAKLSINSPTLCAGLNKHGVVQRKTFTLRYPTLPDHLNRHYIRGYLDGDGCWSKSKKSKCGFTMKICGNYEFLTELTTHFQLPKRHVYKHKSIFSLEKSGMDVVRLMDYLYRDSTIALQRKKERWYVAQSLLAGKLVE